MGLAAVAKRSGVSNERLLGSDRSDAIPIKSEAEFLAVIIRCEPSDLAP